ncbi:MAG: carbohydrate ABC transporter permease [Ruminococcus sp.]
MKKKLRGIEFIIPWLIGTVIFFLIPLFASLYYSFCNVSIDSEKTVCEWISLENYRYIFYTDEYYTDYLLDTLVETLWKTPLIIIFSVFVAVILNQKFKGRTFARAVFFLPVIIASGPVYNIISGNIQSTGSEQFSTMFSADLIGDLMRFLGIYDISEKTEKIIMSISDNIFSIVWSSGIQILIFLSALQNIPQSARDVAVIEGADAWDYFWKVTIPYLSPLFKVNLVFTVIDTFTSPANPVMNRILSMQSEWNYGKASAMAWIYFISVLIFIWLAVFAVRKFFGDSDE